MSRGAREPDGLTWALLGHASFQYLNAGVELGLFDLLASTPGVSESRISDTLSLSARSTRCLLFALTAMGLVDQSGDGYRNSDPVSGLFRDNNWSLFVDVVRFEATFAYVGQLDLVDSLRTGRNVGLERFPGSGSDLYHRLGGRPDLQQVFYRYMGAWTRLGVGKLVTRVDLSHVRKAVDVGGGDGTAAVAIAQTFPALQIDLIELPEAAARAEQQVRDSGLADRIRVRAEDFFATPFPDGVDCFFFFHQLVIWPPDTVRVLLERAYQALLPGGMVVILNSMADDDGCGPLFAALDTAYFVSLPACGGRIYSWADFEHSLTSVGFQENRRVPLDLWTPQGAIVATKR
jgi:L-tyrosine C(3)-methyltransferase